MKKIIDSGVLGDIISIQHTEMVGFWHFAHSYVRGNWRKENTSSFSLLTKCCHDIDLICYFMGQKCTKISSFGSLSHFKKANKPKEAGEAMSCLSCALADTCPYSAKKIYIDEFHKGYKKWPLNVVQPKVPMDIENLRDALNTTNYGTCVYELDNDVSDNHVVNMEFENGSTAAFTMVAFTKEIKRQVIDFRTGKLTIVDPNTEMITPGSVDNSGHKDGDSEFIKAFLRAVRTGDKAHITTGVDVSLESHTYVFAAEESRKSGQIVDVRDFKKKFSLDL